MNFFPLILAFILSTITLFVALRVGFVYPQVRSTRLLILGIAMGTIALTGIADLTSTLVTSFPLHTDWFLYIGQATALLCIFLSLLKTTEGYLQGLLRFQLLASVALLCLVLLSPTLPDIQDKILRATLSAVRCPLSLGICYCYATAFLKKPTRFSALMGAAFLLLGVGYLILVQKYFVGNASLAFDNIGDIVRIGGLVALLVAVLGG
jgi:hypothetical protein